MTCGEFRDRLDELGTVNLDPGEWALVEDHLAGCARCREDYEAARLLGPRLQSLPRSIVPARPLWDGIEDRLAARTSRTRLLRWALPIAAALATVAVGTFVTLRNDLADSPGALPEEVMAIANAYGEAAAEWRAALVGNWSSSRTSGYLETIDRAIEETRSALLADPGNPHLQRHLLSAHRKRLDLLRQASTVRGSE